MRPLSDKTWASRASQNAAKIKIKGTSLEDEYDEVKTRDGEIGSCVKTGCKKQVAGDR